jgi:hypothetical protein
MPYTTPTYADFITRFPVFDNAITYPQSMVEAVLAEMANNIDNTWVEADYQPAIMYMTAHVIATEATASKADSEIGVIKTLTSESFSGMARSWSVQNNGTLSQSEMWGTTFYGRRYLDLLRKNKPAVVVA